MYKTWFMGTLDSVTCTSAIFAWWKVRGSKFAQPPDGGVFGSEALPRDVDADAAEATRVKLEQSMCLS